MITIIQNIWNTEWTWVMSHNPLLLIGGCVALVIVGMIFGLSSQR